MLIFSRWVPFKLMFPEGDELDVPILQISTYAGDDLNAHVQLGKALSTMYEFITLTDTERWLTAHSVLAVFSL
jgi:aromatic ring-opening dioxygenase catalytic subunit (LigB family)